jgi:hypothetical protein
VRKINFIIILFISIAAIVKAQIPVIYSQEFNDTAKLKVGFVADYSLNSNSFTSTFISKFYNGGYINNDLKNQVLDKTKLKNRIGADGNMGIFVAFMPDSFLHKKNIGFFVSLRDRQHFDARFSKDFYKLAFYGNSQFAGETAYLSDFNLNFIRYQQLQFGFYTSRLDSAARLGVAVSFLKGEQYASIYAKQADLFTSEDGQYINFATNMQIAQSDTAKKGLGAFNGAGASIDIFFEAPFKTKIGDAKLSVSVADIGLIRFNKKTLYLNQDTTFHFEGFQINSIYDLQDSTFSNTNQDSIINKVAPFKKQAVTCTLPSVLTIAYHLQLSKRFALTEGLRYVYNGNYNLLLFAKADYWLNKKINVSATFGWGGYGNFNYGVGVYGNLGKGYMIQIGSNNIEGFIVPTKTAGMGAYVSLVKNFK